MPPRGQPPRRHRGRAAFLAGMAVVLAAAVLGVAVLRQHYETARAAAGSAAASAASHGPSGPPPVPAGPAATVRAYFAAINSRRYARAWALGGRNAGSSYRAFVNGFRGTAHDTVTILSVTGDLVTAQIGARQADGSVHVYRGTYRVRHGVITRFRVSRIG